MQTHSSITRASRTLFTLVGLLAPAMRAEAQGSALLWHDTVVRPEGAASLDENLVGELLVSGIGSSGQDGVTMDLPPAAAAGAPASLALEYAALDLLNPASPVNRRYSVTASGRLGGPDVRDLGTLVVEGDPAGGRYVTFDYTSLGATTCTLELWDGGTLVYTDPAVPVGPGGVGPLFIPNCPDPSGYCCQIGAWVWSPGWVLMFSCGGVIHWTGIGPTWADRIVVRPNGVGIEGAELTSATLLGSDLASFRITGSTQSGFDTLGTSYCNAAPNSTGSPGVIAGVGSNEVSHNDVVLHAFQLPPHAFGYFVVSPNQAHVPHAGGSQGTLCVGASTGRFMSQIANSGALGHLSVAVDLTALPQPSGPVAVQPGETWNFQCWHRDTNPMVTSNFTAGYAVTFR